MNADNVELESGGLRAHVLQILFSTGLDGRHTIQMTAQRMTNKVELCTYHDHL